METIKGIRQELFNKAVAGLKEQGFERCANSNGNCVYNLPRADGYVMHCAFGWIADVPNQFNSGYTADELLIGSYGGVIPEAAKIRDAGVGFAMDLQSAHDEGTPRYLYDAYGGREGLEASGPARMWDNLQAFATKFELDASALGDRPL